MKLMKNFLKWILIIFVAFLLSATTMILADWPLWIGVICFIIYLVVILVVTHIVRKKIYEHKTGFIEKDTAVDMASHDCLARLKQMLKQLEDTHNTILFKEFYRMPWAISFDLDSEGNLYELVSQNALLTTKGERQDDIGAAWSVLDNLAVLQPEQNIYENVNNENWIKFLEYISSHRKVAPFNKIILNCSLKMILNDIPSSIYNRIDIIKHRITQIFQITGYSIPVIVVFNDLNEVQNFDAFAEALTLNQKQQAFGIYNQDKSINATQSLWEQIAGSLNNFIDEASYNSEIKDLDALYQFLYQLSQLQNAWESLRDTLFKPSSIGKIELSGLFFVGEKINIDNVTEYIFAQDLVQTVLAKQNIRPMRTLFGIQRAKMDARMKLYIYYGIFGLFILYTIFSFISTSLQLSSVLKAVPQRLSYTSDLKQNLFTISNYNRLMENILAFKKRWVLKVLPFDVGINKLEKTYSQRFTEQFNDKILALLHQHLVSFLRNNINQLTPLQRAYAIENIIERINIIQAKLDNQSFEYIQQLDPPELNNLGFHEMKQSVLEHFGHLYKLYVWWQNDPAVLREEKGQLISFLTEFKLLNHSENMDWIVAWANTQPDIQPVLLSDYWHGDKSLDSVYISPAYTEQGSMRVKKLLDEINKALPGYMNMNYQEDNFNQWYMTQRLNAWYEFVLYFHKGVESLKYQSQWDKFFDSSIMLSTKGPYYRLLDDLYTQFSDLPIKNPPAWLIQIKQFYALLDFQVRKNIISKVDNLQTGANQKLHNYTAKVASVTRNYLEKITEKPSVIRQRNSLSDYYQSSGDDELKAAQAFLNYQIQLYNLYKPNSYALEQAYSIAKGVYSVKDESDSPDSKIVHNAFNSFETMRKYLGGNASSQTIFWFLLRGPFDFYVDYVNRNASCYTQQQWVNNVVKSTQGLSGDELTKMLFGNKGIAWSFTNKYLQPFLEIYDNTFVPRLSYGHIFPFNDNFYNFINRGLTIQAVNREQNQFENYFNKNGGRILGVTSYPTSVNSGARALPYKVTLSTMCKGKPFEIKNLNFPVTDTLQWELGQCGPAQLTVYFKTFTLHKNYPGQYGFAQFLYDFMAGPKVLTAQDFPEDAQKFNSYNIQSITLNYKITGLEGLEGRLGAFFRLNDKLMENENKYLVDGALPQSIALCWQNSLLQKIYRQEGAEIRDMINDHDGPHEQQYNQRL